MVDYLKKSTGNDEHLLGSGSTDCALWLSSSQSFYEKRVTLFGAAGGLLMSQSTILPEQQRQTVAFGTVGGSWQLLFRLSLKAQLDGHTSLYSGSSLEELSESLQRILGGTLGLSGSTALDIAVSEDLVVNSAPDVVFYLALRQKF